MIEVKTILNENLVRRFNNGQTMKKIWLPFVLMIAFVVPGVIGLALKWDTFISVFLIAVGLLLPVIYLFTARFMLNRMLKNSPALKNGTTQIWRFLEDKIIFNESGKYVQAHDTQIEYDALFKAEESDTAFYLYISKIQAYILDVKGFTMGSRRELHNLLEEKLGKAFKYPKRIYAKR